MINVRYAEIQRTGSSDRSWPVRACCHAWRADVRKPTRPRLRRDGVTIDGVSALGFVVLFTSRSRDLETQPKRLAHLS